MGRIRAGGEPVTLRFRTSSAALSVYPAIPARFDGADACKQDLSVTYRGMAPVMITGFDVCRSDRLYLGKTLAKALRTVPRGTR